MSDIGDAIQEMREGGKVRRAGWGAGKWLEIGTVGSEGEDDTIILRTGETVPGRPWLAEKEIADDLLADDWEGLD